MEVVVKKKHSELGIISCCTLIFTEILFVSVYLIKPYNAYIFFAWIFLLLFLPFCALILGIIGLRQKDRKKSLPILGIVASILGFLLNCASIAIILSATN